MKILKKINKGLILTIIVLVALTIYLVGVEKQRKADKADIQKACEEFISFTDKYLVLPKEIQALTEPIPESKIKEYETEMKTELENLMISNEEAVKIQNKFLIANLESGYTSEEIRNKYERKIIKISNYEFEGDQVTVTFRSKVETSTKYLNEENEEQEENLPKIELNKKEIKSQKEQSINELNEAVMASPEDAAKLITSFIKD